LPDPTAALGAVTETTNDQRTNLSPGSYMLKAVPSADPGAHPVQVSGEDRTEIVPTWFPSTIESAQAEHIVVRGGAELPGNEIRLRTAPVYPVRGIVLTENGDPKPRALVYNASASEQFFVSGFSRMVLSAKQRTEVARSRRGLSVTSP
jgi:hypothetical protein